MPNGARDRVRRLNERLLAWVRIGLAALVVAGVATQVSSLVAAGVFNPTRFFLFFTVLP